MKDPIAQGLELLASGLRPFVAARAEFVLRRDFSEDLAAWDAAQLMLFMWERWNDLFRTELSFVERSLVSELREYRNRWAHQSRLSERDTYRVLDSVERLLFAINAPEQHAAGDLRRESLNRLWQNEVEVDAPASLVKRIWPYLLCGASAVAIDTALIAFVSMPWALILSLLVLLATMRIAWMQSQRESRQGPGPRECSHCGRIIYSPDCPYCYRASMDQAEAAREPRMPRSVLAGSWTAFRLNEKPSAKISETVVAATDQTKAGARPRHLMTAVEPEQSQRSRENH